MAQKINIVIPTIGESVSEGTIGKWFFKEGDIVSKDQALLEVDSDKATLEVAASASGRLSILVPAGKAAAVGATVGVIEAAEGASNGKSTSAASSSSQPAPMKTEPSSAMQPVSKESSESNRPAPVSSPASSVDEDTLKILGPSKRKAAREGTWTPPSKQAAFFEANESGLRRVPMTTLRKKIAERLILSQQSTATLTTFNEVDMTKVMDLRNKLKEKFQTKHSVKLGFMSFFSKAVIQALQSFPDVNAKIDGDDIVYSDSVHLGIAVSTDRGLVVPVIRNASKLNYGQLEIQIGDMAERARNQKLQIPEMSGGTFTITNGGTFGSLLSTPIINPPQSGILGMHKIEYRPIAIAKDKGSYSVEVRPMMYIALSYDHRIIDGITSVSFLVKVKEYLESIEEAQIDF